MPTPTPGREYQVMGITGTIGSTFAIAIDVFGFNTPLAATAPAFKALLVISLALIVLPQIHIYFRDGDDT